MTSGAAAVLFWLLVAHALTDYILQSRAVNNDKNRRAAHDPGVVWLHAMAAHCLVNAGGVALATGSVPLGCAEFVAHFVIDVLRCEGCTTGRVDQALHVVTKLVWTMIWCRCRG